LTEEKHSGPDHAEERPGDKTPEEARPPLETWEAASDTPPGHHSGFVSIVGRPNVGKSTLLNRLVESKVAIVSPVPQTTRHRILGVLTRPDFQVVFVDTPGIHRPLYEMNRRMLRLAYQALEGMEIVLLMVDASVPFGSGDRFVTSRLREIPGTKFLVLNKVDIIRKSRLLPLIETYQEMGEFAEFLPVSSSTGDGVDLLLGKIRERLPPGPRYYPEGQVTDMPRQFLLAEMVREQVFHKTRQEVPHSTAVLVDEMREKKDGLMLLRATIYVERENQKRIVIGNKGKMLKEIGTAARREIERFLGCRVYLDLWVKAAPHWREDTRMLDRFMDPGRS